jgi:hypothetical protein
MREDSDSPESVSDMIASRINFVISMKILAQNHGVRSHFSIKIVISSITELRGGRTRAGWEDNIAATSRFSNKQQKSPVPDFGTGDFC